MSKCHNHKKGIVITARVHPGEAQASWICQGLIEFLLSDLPEAIAIRKQFIIKIIPMLNPDGVRYGNYRCSLCGFDLNRKWLQPNKIYDPTVYYTKKLISVFKEERDIQLYCDIHGHSRKKNAFMYGCEYGIFDYDSRAKNAILRLFPAFMEQKNKCFRFKDCSFKVEKSKEETGRIVCFKEFGIRHSFTLESTFYGRERTEEDGEDKDMHMDISDFKKLGEDLAKCFVNF